MKVPVAITAFSDVALHEQNIVSLEDIASMTPALSFQDVNNAFQNPSIRGLTQTSQIATQGNVGVFLDGVFLSNRSAMEFGALDMARVEVVKGPQSALYGRNTFGGAINYVTRTPDLGEVSGRVRAEIGSDDWRVYSGNVNLPLGEIAAVQLFGGVGEFDGTINNAGGLNDAKLGGFQKRDTLGARIFLQPSDKLRFTLFGMRGELINDAPALILTSFEDNNAGSPTIGGFNGTGDPGFTAIAGETPTLDTVTNFSSQGLLAETNMFYAKLEYDFSESMSLSVLASDYSTETALAVDIVSDPDAVNTPFFGPFSRQTLLDASTPLGDSTSLEVRLQNSGDGPFEWSIGGYYFDADDENNLAIFFQPLGDPDGDPLLFFENRTRTSTIASSIFGSVGYAFNDRFSGTLEFRYTDEVIDLLDQPQAEEADFSFFVPRLTLEYIASNDVLIYGSIGQGLKTGGFNTNAAFGIAERQFEEESNWSYEVGAKGVFFDGKLELTTSAWYVDWRDVQVQGNIAGTDIGVTLNSGSITSTGVEFDANINVTDNFSVRLGGAVMDPSYDSGFVDGEIAAACGDFGTTIITNPGCSSNVGGNQVSRTSDFQFIASGKYEVPSLFSDMDAYARVDFSHEAGKYSTGLNLNNQGDINLTNLRLGLQNERFEISIYVDNVFDEKWTRRVTAVGNGTDGFPNSGVLGYRNYPGQLRTVGGSLTVNF